MPTIKSSWNPSFAYQALSVTSSEAPTRAKSLTPMIAGSVCGGAMGIAWIVGFTIYFAKRYKRKKLNRQIAAGTASSKKKPSKVPGEKIIIPPDPAVLLGHRLPGERVFQEVGTTGGERNLKSESQKPLAPSNNSADTPRMEKPQPH